MKMNKSYCYIPTLHMRTVHCAQCDQTIEVPSDYIEYIYDNKKFCSWTCKCRYKKAHPIEEESHSEQVINKKERYNAKNTN